jgi:hypothetical protein
VGAARLNEEEDPRSNDKIRESITGAIAYLVDHPDEARYRDTAATAVIEEGLRCRVEGPAGRVGASKRVAARGWSIGVDNTDLDPERKAAARIVTFMDGHHEPLSGHSPG